MGTVGTISEFDINSSWDLYIEQVTFFLEANNITDANKQRATLLAVCGMKTLSVLKSLLYPDKPFEKSFQNIVTILGKHFSPKASEIYCRFKFQKRIQRNGESLTDYVTDLRRLAEECNFQGTLNERLRDQFVCGILNESIQRSLLSESKLSLDDAISKAYSAETAANQAKNIHLCDTTRSAYKNNSESVDLVRHKSNNSKSNATPSSYTKPIANAMNGICHGCGGQHDRSNCKFRNSICHNCKKRGHISKVCRLKNNFEKQNTPNRPTFNKLHEVKVENLNNEKFDYIINSVNKIGIPHKEKATVLIEGKKCDMEVDSGSFYSIMSNEVFNKLFSTKKLLIHPSSVKLSDFQKNPISIKGMCIVKVIHKSHKAELELLIANSKCTTILGYSWFQPLGIHLVGLNSISHNPVEEIVKKFDDVFSEKIGTYKGPLISLPIDPKVNPIRCKARSVPLAMRSKINAVLDKLLAEDIIEPISNPTWSTPVVPIIKPSGEVRLCGDYKITLNTAMNDHPYPIPTVNHLLSNLTGGVYFAKIDLAQAYLQLVVDDKSAEAQTIITHRGAYKVKRLQYGIKVAPGLFQNLMDDLLGKLDGVIPYFDDVLIHATDMEQLANRLTQVLTRLREAGLHVKKEKCQFGVSEIEFLGFRIDAEGIHPSKTKVEAIQNAPRPTNKVQLQSFLGLLNFYHSFLPNKATIVEPLHKLLKKNVPWKWSKQHDNSFNAVKNLISSSNVLVPFNEKLPVLLTCDASPYGVGSVLSHQLPDGREAPIAFASRTLTETERNYSQIDKEALSVISAVKKFHHFLYGRNFTIITDHKPLLGLFSNSKPTPDIISPRMLRWTLILNSYDFKLIHRPGKKIQHADALSRLPQETPEFEIPPFLEVLFLEELEDPPLHARDIAKMTTRDPILSRVLNWVLRGWPEEKVSPEFQTFFTKRNELSVHKNCLLWGNRVIIPNTGQERVLKELHLTHPGIEHMKALARSYVWWPHMDTAIEKMVKQCTTCQETRHKPPRAPIHPWEVTSSPWSRLHIDFAGPFQGQNFLIVIDSFSKWLEVRSMPSTTSSATIDVLREIFSTHGIPDTVVSDNGPQFTSSDFRHFLKSNTIKHVLISPYHPSSNGQAERMVQTFKDSLKRIVQGNVKKRLANFLLRQHITPSSSTGLSPSELLMHRRIKTYLDRLHPDLVHDLREKQETFVNNELEKGNYRYFIPKDPVFIQNFSSGAPWIPATVVEPSGPLSYKALTPSGDIVRRHIDQMRDRVPADVDPPSLDPDNTNSDNLPCPSPGEASPVPRTVSPGLKSDDKTPMRPRRTITRPRHFKDFVLT